MKVIEKTPVTSNASPPPKAPSKEDRWETELSPIKKSCITTCSEHYGFSDCISYKTNDTLHTLIVLTELCHGLRTFLIRTGNDSPDGN